jgi:hypothetical protein
VKLKVTNSPGIDGHTHHQRQQLPKRLGFMQSKDKREPVFGVVGDHGPKLNDYELLITNDGLRMTD